MMDQLTPFHAIAFDFGQNCEACQGSFRPFPSSKQLLHAAVSTCVAAISKATPCLRSLQMAPEDAESRCFRLGRIMREAWPREKAAIGSARRPRMA
jgi:hypothetical protein